MSTGQTKCNNSCHHCEIARDKRENGKKVLIAVISNRQYWPKNFSISLTDLLYETRRKQKIKFINVISGDVSYMRNKACLHALNKGKYASGERFDYLVMLDDDHIYPSDFINEFIKHDKDVVVGCTSRRIPPFTQTQFKEIRGIDMNNESNIVNPKEDEGLIRIGASGCAGICIKVDILEKMRFPYFETIILNSNPEIRGEDINFCQKLKDEVNGEIWLDSAFSFPHSVGEPGYVDRGKVGYYG